MENRLKSSASSRMRPDLEAAIEYLPGLASLALWCRFADTDRDVIAYTDGSTIFAGAMYVDRDPEERRFICLHEVLHIALCHPNRFAELKKREPGGFDPELLNIAADAIINGSLEKLTGLKIPTDACTLEKIWRCLEKSEDTVRPPVKNDPGSYSSMLSQENRKIANLTKREFTAVNRWSCEELYRFLKTQSQTGTQFYLELTAFNSESLLGNDLRPAGSEHRQEKSELAKISGAGISLVDSEQQKRDWQQRLSLLRGTEPGLLERLAAELPRVETPWEQILRSLIQTALQEETHKNYSRPSRRWLALERDYHSQAGVSLPFVPESIKKRGARLAVALDTSGSIDGELLGRFLSEIASLCALNQRNLVLLIGDAVVHEITEIDWRDAGAELSRLEYPGGGGTDFRPLIKAAGDFQPDALIYLTDLYGETGEVPDFPVVWATHGVCGEAPWGDEIKLK